MRQVRELDTIETVSFPGQKAATSRSQKGTEECSSEGDSNRDQHADGIANAPGDLEQSLYKRMFIRRLGEESGGDALESRDGCSRARRRSTKRNSQPQLSACDEDLDTSLDNDPFSTNSNGSPGTDTEADVKPLIRSVSTGIADYIKAGRVHNIHVTGYSNVNAIAYQSREWHWLNKSAFWIAVSFCEGSLLFIVGSMASFFHLQEEWMRGALVELCFLVGSLAFTIGAYLGWFSVINVGQDTTVFISGPERVKSRAAYWGALMYLLGAVLYNVTTALPFLPMSISGWGATCIGLTAAVVGSALFCAGAVIELRHNEDEGVCSRVFWLCVLYLSGSVLFLVGGCVDLALFVAAPADTQGIMHEHARHYGVDGSYALGSVAFLLGAWVSLQMWKHDQFGLGFIREVNALLVEYRWKERGAPLQRAFGLSEQLFHAVYITLGVASTVNACLSYALHQHISQDAAQQAQGVFSSWGCAQWRGVSQVEEMMSSATRFVTAHIILMGAALVHGSATLEPYPYVVHLLRGLASLSLCSSALKTATFFHR
mmetsp:Transcript_41345/g.86598  ORF Transcript_41345/g.86598 Transcript_41345/m.86598 type:complete len:543 (-) Transcript_41345:107-1735(-)